MNKSKWQIFGVLWILLTIFSLCLVFIFNHQVYHNEKSMLYENIDRMKRYTDKNFGNRYPLPAESAGSAAAPPGLWEEKIAWKYHE